MKRFEWLANIINQNRYKHGAELGVMRGRTTFHILGNCKSLETLICVDPWKPQDVLQEKPNGEWVDYNKRRPTNKKFDHARYKKEFFNNAKRYKNRMIVYEGLSDDRDILNSVKDGFLDFVFIDGDHSYEGAKNDILNWSPKVRSNGLVCGHDADWPGVKKAIDELVPNYEIVADSVWYIFKE